MWKRIVSSKVIRINGVRLFTFSHRRGARLRFSLSTNVFDKQASMFSASLDLADLTFYSWRTDLYHRPWPRVVFDIENVGVETLKRVVWCTDNWHRRWEIRRLMSERIRACLADGNSWQVWWRRRMARWRGNSLSRRSHRTRSLLYGRWSEWFCTPSLSGFFLVWGQ